MSKRIGVLRTRSTQQLTHSENKKLAPTVTDDRKAIALEGLKEYGAKWEQLVASGQLPAQIINEIKVAAGVQDNG